MGKLTLIGCSGLMTDQNAVAAPMGALRVADDVVIDRPGVASPRPGFSYNASKTTSRRPRSMRVWGAVPIIVSWDGSAWQAESTSATISGEAEPLDYQISFPQFTEARSNLYWTSKKGPRKITSTADTAADASGMHEAPSGLPSVVSTGTPAILPTNYATAWRWCFRKIDANSVETRSAPSPWSTMTNNSGSTQDMSWIIPLPLYVAADDQIELYRAIAVTPYTSIPSDTMYLAVTYLVTSADVTAGYATVTDRTPEAALGQELYTNPSREGALKRNGRPPACVAIARWEDCMWFGYVRGPYTASIDIVTVTGSTSTDGLTGLQRLQRTGDSTNGSATLTNLASTTSIKVGQLVSAGTPGSFPTGFGAPVTVVSKTATTVTVSAAATSSNVGATYRFHDGVTVDGLTYWASTSDIVDASYPAFTVTTGNRERSTARGLAYVISRVSSGVFAYAVEDPYYRNVTYDGSRAAGEYTQATVVIRSRELDDAAWSVSIIADTTSSPPAIAYRANTSGGVLVQRDDFANAIAYSKPGEPEHVPDLNFITIGNEGDPVYAFAPLRAALLVFKRDGIYRVTGSAPDGWRVDILAPGVRILRGECVDALDGNAYVWTDAGLLEVNEGGTRNLSDGKIGMDLRSLSALVVSDSTTTGAWVCAHARRRFVLVGVPSNFTEQEADTAYCLSLTTGAWSRWTAPTYCAAYGAKGGSLFIARGGSYWEIRKMTPPYYGEQFASYDRLYSLLTWTNASGSTEITITDANRGDWVPKAGDWVSCSVDGKPVEYRRVTAAVDAGTSYTLTIASAFTAGAVQTSCTAYEGIISKIQWQARGVVPTDTARLSRGHVVLDWTAYSGSIGGNAARVLLGAATNVTPTVTTQEVTTETRAAKLAEIDITPSRAIARAAYWMPYFETDDIGLEWRLLGVALDIEGVGGRADR